MLHNNICAEKDLSWMTIYDLNFQVITIVINYDLAV